MRTALLVFLVFTVSRALGSRPDSNVKNDLNSRSIHVINGDPVTDAEEYKFVVDLSTSPDQVSSTRFCTGTLIRSNIILTAAHCVLNDGERGTGTFATVGRINLQDDHRDNSHSESFHCDAGLVHPDYDGLGSSADVALLLLDGMSSISPVTLSRETPSKSTVGWIVGYGIQVLGTVEETGEAIEIMPSRMQKTALRIENRNFCDVPGSLETAEGMLCTSGLHSGSSACRGDSGGGLFIDGTKSVKVQIGIVSYGDAMCRSKDSGVFTDVAAVYDWIQAAAEQLQQIQRNVDDIEISSTGRLTKHTGLTTSFNSSQNAFRRAVINPSLKYYRLKLNSRGPQRVTAMLCIEAHSEKETTTLFMASRKHTNMVSSIYKGCKRSNDRGYTLSFDAQRGTHVLGMATKKPLVEFELIVKSEQK